MREDSRPAPRPGPGEALRWLRERLAPGGTGALMIAAYAIILTALITFIVFERAQPRLNYVGTIMALAALLALNITWPDIDARLGKPRADTVVFGASAALFLAANYLGLGEGWGFLPFVLFMISSQAIVTLGPARGIGYSVALTGAWFLVLALRRADPDLLLANLLSIGLGQIFTITFSTVLLRYGEQTARAEGLLAELRAANAALEAAREREKELAAAEERVRLARDIHDGLGHHLTVLNVQLQAAARLIERDPARAAQTIAVCREEAQAALDEVRQSVAAMRRSPLDGRSLPEALAALVGDFNRAASLRAELALVGEPGEAGPAAAMTLYRAAQEGLTNAQKHAGAGGARVELEYAPGHVRLRVRDDGAEGPGPEPGPTGGFGLAGLRERAERLGGSLRAGPQPGGGFLLEIEVPL